MTCIVVTLHILLTIISHRLGKTLGEVLLLLLCYHTVDKKIVTVYMCMHLSDDVEHLF